MFRVYLTPCIERRRKVRLKEKKQLFKLPLTGNSFQLFPVLLISVRFLRSYLQLMFFSNRLFMKRWKPDRWDKHSSQVDHPVFVNMWRDLCTLSRRIRCGQGCKVVWQCFSRLKINGISQCLLLPKHTNHKYRSYTFNFKTVITLVYKVINLCNSPEQFSYASLKIVDNFSTFSLKLDFWICVKKMNQKKLQLILALLKNDHTNFRLVR